MKLIYLVITVVITFSLILITSMALDLIWIDTEIVRKITIYILMILELATGFLVAKELLREP